MAGTEPKPEGPKQEGSADGRAPHKQALVFSLGHAELIVRRRYEAASICNDVLIAVWFILGSIMFFSEAWTTTGTFCFLAGSVELLIRPLIRLSRQFHLKRFRPRGSTVPRETAEDY
ncbi:YrhK family protein [Streptomyces sulphureus]|uniref:YrhK family protein n=1 Tax=Streptomyces sulphureus TaxID=47758 RepID=UPI000366A98D|nr:YrhK family protein [Streptomyces sulphureus]